MHHFVLPFSVTLCSYKDTAPSFTAVLHTSQPHHSLCIDRVMYTHACTTSAIMSQSNSAQVLLIQTECHYVFCMLYCILEMGLLEEGGGGGCYASMRVCPAGALSFLGFAAKHGSFLRAETHLIEAGQCPVAALRFI